MRTESRNSGSDRNDETDMPVGTAIDATAMANLVVRLQPSFVSVEGVAVVVSWRRGRRKVRRTVCRRVEQNMIGD